MGADLYRMSGTDATLTPDFRHIVFSRVVSRCGTEERDFGTSAKRVFNSVFCVCYVSFLSFVNSTWNSGLDQVKDV